jgi:alpha-tubulin suppressor-like RCC1 family protein
MRAIATGTVLVCGLLSSCESTTDPVELVRLQLVNGGDQVGGAGSTLEAPITVEVVDREGRPMTQLDVHWQAVQGGGAVTAPLTRTDSAGRTSTRWTLGVDVGTQLLVARAANATLTVHATSEFRIVQITAGYRHTCALSSAGALYCWGGNFNGQLGDGTHVDRAEPLRVTSAVPFRYVNAGWFHTCGVSHFDQMFCWGDNSAGQLGIGPPGPFQSRPARVTTIPTAIEIAGGYVHTCALEASGELSCWGENERGRLASASEVISVAAGEFHSCALRRGGQAVCWGWNSIGELGGDAPVGAVVHVHLSKPGPVEGATGFTRIATGNTHTCGVAAGSAYCWGSWLGNGSAAPSTRPVRVQGLTAVTEVAAGFDHACAIARAEVWCWGSNAHGQLGSEGVQQSLLPVRVNF